MAEYINEALISEIASKMSIKTEQVKAVLALLNEDATIPFIARYRKEVTGSLDEEQIREISKEHEYGVALNKRKEDVIRLIDEKGMLTEELRKEIEEADKLITIEDIYRPFKEKKKTKATEAIANGLEPLANYIVSYPAEGDVIAEASKYVNENVKTPEDAIQGAKYIIAERISDNKDYREYIRTETLANGFVESSKKKNAEDPKETYRDYYEYKEQIKVQKTHRVLALNRGEDEKILTVNVVADSEKHISHIVSHEVPQGFENAITANLVVEACEDAYDRLIYPSIEREVRAILTEKAEDNAIALFGSNLNALLLTAPLKGKNVLGVDPAFRTGCKLAALDKTGKVLAIAKIEQNQKFPDEKVPEKRIKDAMDTVEKFCKEYSIDVIAIGNGTASRETERFIADTIKDRNLTSKYIIVSEAGASVYSASKLAIEEFPDFHVEERSAVSIGRRIQDPLAELVKIDPKSIGVGQYQHDVDQKKLQEQLDFVVEKAVNTIGVNVNTASKSLLQYVSGLNKKTADAIVTYRESNGEYKNREGIKDVPGIGPKAFEQSIGFLRIPESTNALDKTSIHPEQYAAANASLTYLGFTSNDLGSDELKAKIESVDASNMAQELGINPITLEDILKAFVAPTRDPRDELPQPELKSNVTSLSDLVPGMEMQGTVRNITDFGCFVDLGVHESGLLHISKMSTRKINHPSDIVKVGDIIKVWVLEVDMERERLSLTAIDPNAPKEEKKKVEYKKPERKPMLKFKDLTKGMELKGKVRKIVDFGCFVDLENSYESGLVHISRMAVTKVEKPTDVVKEGDIVNVWVFDVNQEKKELSLSLVNPSDLPKPEPKKTFIPIESIKAGMEMTGVVKTVADYGCFVDLGCRVNGLVHKTRIAPGKVENVADYVKEGDTVNVFVVDVDYEKKKIALSMYDPLEELRSHFNGR